MKKKMTSRAAWTGSDSERRNRTVKIREAGQTMNRSDCGPGTCRGPGRSAVHAASMTRVPAVRWSPAHVTVTVFITVTHLEDINTGSEPAGITGFKVIQVLFEAHPVTAALLATFIHTERRHVLTFLV